MSEQAVTEKLFDYEVDPSLKRVTTEELSGFMGISSRRIQQLAEELPAFGRARYGHGKWICAKAIQAYIEFRTREEEQTRADEKYHEKRLTKFKADREELRLKEEQRELARVDEVHAVYRDKVLMMRSKILLLPRRLASLKMPGTVREREVMIAEELDQALQELSGEEQNVEDYD